MHVASDGTTRQSSGSVRSIDTRDVELDVDPAEWSAGDKGLFVAFAGLERFRNTGEVVAKSEDSVSWRLRAAWVWWGDERRAEVRLPCFLSAEIAQDGGNGIACTIVNISRGGAAVSADHRLRETTSHLLVSVDGLSSWFPCTVVSVGESPAVGHLAFGGLDRRQDGLLDRILARCESDWAGVARALRRP